MSTPLVASQILGVFLFLFVFWRRLKEDYESSLIFSTQAFMVGSVVTAHLVAKYFLPQAWFWLDFLGFMVGFALGVLKFRLKFYELLDAACLGGLFWLAPIFITYSLVENNLASLIASAFLVALIVAFHLVDARYKNFSWYKSGKIGFSGLSITGIFFLTRAITSLLLMQSVVSFGGRFETYLSGVLAFGSFLLLYNLAGKKV